MTKYIGREVAVGFVKEAVRGTGTAVTAFEPHLELTLDVKETKATDEVTVGRIEDSVNSANVEDYAEGSLRGLVQADSFGLILLATFGTVNTTLNDPEATVNTHDFTVANDAQHQALTLAEVNPDENLQYPLTMIDGLDIAVTLQEFISYTARVRSKTPGVATNTVAYAAETKFVPQFATAKVAANLAGLDAAGAVDLKALNLTITKNVEDDRNFGSKDPSDILNRQFVVEGSFELLYDASTFKDLLVADTAQALRLQLINTDVTIGAATNPEVRFDLAKVKFVEIARNLTLNEMTRQTLTFKAYLSITDSSMITAKLINTTTAY
jgi:hypothetical protein